MAPQVLHFLHGHVEMLLQHLVFFSKDISLAFVASCFNLDFALAFEHGLQLVYFLFVDGGFCFLFEASFQYVPLVL